jgi:hypothetical protein
MGSCSEYHTTTGEALGSTIFIFDGTTHDFHLTFRSVGNRRLGLATK